MGCGYPLPEVKGGSVCQVCGTTDEVEDGEKVYRGMDGKSTLDEMGDAILPNRVESGYEVFLKYSVPSLIVLASLAFIWVGPGWPVWKGSGIWRVLWVLLLDVLVFAYFYVHWEGLVDKRVSRVGLVFLKFSAAVLAPLASMHLVEMLQADEWGLIYVMLMGPIFLMTFTFYWMFGMRILSAVKYSTVIHVIWGGHLWLAGC